ncbi:MAG: PASTA domain-containing protein [Rhodothermales bacterium]
MKVRALNFLRYIKTVVLNPYFWGGLGALIAAGLLIYVLFDKALMPSVTRHGASVTVPDVVSMTEEEAKTQLEAQNLSVKTKEQRFNPNQARDVVVDQLPAPNSMVKPGRSIYITINSGEVPEVSMPNVVNLPVREAINQLQSKGLRVEEAQPDTIPSPYANTITRQEPDAGDTLPKGSVVEIWYSRGLGDTYVSVPDVTNMSVSEARRALRAVRLNAAIFPPDADDGMVVVSQRKAPGTRMREGAEIRLDVEADGLGGN